MSNVYKWTKMGSNNKVNTDNNNSAPRFSRERPSANTRLLRPPNSPIMPNTAPYSASRPSTTSTFSANARLRRTPNLPYSEQELATGAPLTARSMIRKIEPVPPGCICERPSAQVVCGICGNIVESGRVRMRCGVHPKAVFLLDMTSCGTCGCEKERYLKEYPKNGEGMDRL